MKTHQKPLLRFLILLALVSAPHLASAYYDPGVQRWINRDPLGESGFETARCLVPPQLRRLLPPGEYLQGANLYGFLQNRPLSAVDPEGLASTAFCRAFAGFLISAVMPGSGFSDASIIALNTLYQSMCGTPPRTPLPGRPIDPHRGKPPPDPSLNKSWCKSWLRPLPYDALVIGPDGALITAGACLGLGGALAVGAGGSATCVLAPAPLF